jgi:hypothetical protein
MSWGGLCSEPLLVGFWYCVLPKLPASSLLLLLLVAATAAWVNVFSCQLHTQQPIMQDVVGNLVCFFGLVVVLGVVRDNCVQL